MKNLRVRNMLSFGAKALICFMTLGLSASSFASEGSNDIKKGSGTTKANAVFYMLIPEFNDVELERVFQYSKSSEKHFNEKIAKQLSLINSRYLIFPKKDTTYYALLRKPNIYYSMEKVTRYYKRVIRKFPSEKEKFCNELSEFLGKVIVVGNYDTKDLELNLDKAGKLEEILSIYATIEEFELQQK